MRLLTWCFLIFLGTALLARPVRADLYDEAVRADQEGIPEVSIQKLRIYLTGSSTAQAAAARLLLAKCLLSTNQPAAALQVLDSEALKSSDGRRLRAEALLRSGRWVEAEEIWTEILNDPNLGTTTIEARLGLAEAQQQLGATREALQTLAPLIQDQTVPPKRPVLHSFSDGGSGSGT